MKKTLIAFGFFFIGSLFYLLNTGNAQFISQWLLSNDGTKLLSRVSTVTEICQSDGTTCTGFSGGTPAGADTQIQFNNSGSFGASSDFTFNDSTDTMSVANITSLATLTGVTGGLTLDTVSNGDITISPNGTGTVGITSSLDIGGSWTITELSADPSNPAEGKTTCWQSDGTGTGDDGDIYCSTTAGATTKDIQVTDFSAGTLASAGGGNKTIFLTEEDCYGFDSSKGSQNGILIWDWTDNTSEVISCVWSTPDDFVSISSLKFYWSTPTTSANAYLSFESRAVGLNEATNTGGSSDSLALTTYGSSSTARGMNIDDVTGAINGLIISSNDVISIAVRRNSTDANDTLNASAYFIGLQIIYN